jgi:hypothetical protein
MKETNIMNMKKTGISPSCSAPNDSNKNWEEEKFVEEDVDYDSEETTEEVKKELKEELANPETPERNKRIKALRGLLVPIYDAKEQDWKVGGCPEDDNTQVKKSEDDNTQVKKSEYDNAQVKKSEYDNAQVKNFEGDNAQTKRESSIDFVVEKMETEMPSYIDPED